MHKYLTIAVTSLLLSTSIHAQECTIMTSPIDLSKMRFGYSSWYVQTAPIVSGKDFKFTSFVDAYSDFDKKFTQYIQETVCEKGKWDGVANYKITWQQTKNSYNFVGTYDAYSNQ